MHTISWEVKYLSPPEAERFCGKCGSRTRHISSDRFRVNAQKKLLDIWLIFKCAKYGRTWNMEIYSRVNPKSLEGDLLDKFIENDRELARNCAADTRLLKKSGAEPESAEFEVSGPDVNLSRESRIIINAPYSSALRMSAVLRKKLSLSGREFKGLTEAGYIRLEDGGDIRKCALGREIAVLIGVSAGKEISE